MSEPSGDRVQDLFDQAVALPTEQRAAFLEAACAGDPAVRAEVESLLACDAGFPEGTAEGLLKSPLVHSREPPTTLPGEPLPATWPPGSAPRVGHYRLLSRIAEGGMGAVWLAEQQEPVRRLVAVKLIRAGLGGGQAVARFEAERQALALMDHPNIAKVLDGGATADGQPYLVMELVKGVPITRYCDEHRLTPRQRLELFVPVCRALQHAHQKGVIHRDIKPSNVLVAPYDDTAVPKVLDFGIAKAAGQRLTDKTLLTEFGAVVGTLEYMSPEQADLSNQDIDTRSDVYSLGVLLYELLTGSTPLTAQRWKAAPLLEVLRAIREEEPPRPSTRLGDSGDTLPVVSAQRQTDPARLRKLVRGELDWIVMKALEKDRSRRYESANGLARDIERFLGGEPVEACPPTAGYRLRKFVGRNKGAVIAAGVILFCLLAGISGTSAGLVWAVRERDAKEEARKDAVASEAEAQAAAAAEKQANALAQNRLTQVRKSNEVLKSIFKDLDIRQVKEGNDPLEAVLGNRLVKAAEQLEEQAVGDPLVVAELQSLLGGSLLSLGHPRDAIPLFVKARVTRTSLLGADHPYTLATMGNLGMAYLDARNLELAVPLLEEALKRWQANLGTDHPGTVTTMRILAEAYAAAGKRNLALPLFEQALKHSRAARGTDHPVTLAIMSDLALCYQPVGKLDLAVPLLQEALNLRKVQSGADHPQTLKAMSRLGSAHLDTRKPELAVPLLEETLKLMKAKLGADHPETLVAMNNLGRGYQGSGKLDLALALWEEALKPMKARLGADHPNTLSCTANLASGYLAAGKLDLALPLFQDAAAGIERRRLQHPGAANTFAGLITCHERLEQFDQAETCRRRWLALAREHAGAGSVAYADALVLSIASLLRRQRWAEAEPLLRECLAIREKQTPDAWETFDAMSRLGSVLLAQKKYADAEPLLLAGYEGLSQRVGTMPPRVRNQAMQAVPNLLVRLYVGWGKPTEAARWRKKLEAAKKPKEKD